MFYASTENTHKSINVFLDRIYVCSGQKLNINFINKNWILKSMNLPFMHTNVVEQIAGTSGSSYAMEIVQN